MKPPNAENVAAPSKSGGAIVIPGDVHVQRAVDATELQGQNCPTLEGPLKPSKVHVEGVAPNVPQVKLVYRHWMIAMLALLSALFIEIWCILFLYPRGGESCDANAMSRDAVRELLKSKETFLSLPRTVLAAVMTNLASQVVAVFFIKANLLTTRTSTGKCIEWVMKHGVPYFLCLPLVGLVYQEQPMQVTPAIGPSDLGVFDSLLVDATPDRTHYQLRSCSYNESQSANEFTSVTFEFLTNEWQSQMLPNGVDPVKIIVIPGSGRSAEPVPSNSSFAPKEVSTFKSLFTLATYLYADAVRLQDADLGAANAAALRQLKLDSVAYSTNHSISSNTSAPDMNEISDYVRTFFRSTTAWSTLLRANVSDINVEYAKFALPSDISFFTVALDIPLESTIWHRRLGEANGSLVDLNTPWPGSGDVEYELDVVNECGPTTCGIQNRGIVPEPKVVAYAACPWGGNDCTDHINLDSMWLFGFGRRIEGERFELLDPPANPKLRKAVVTNPREFHRITMGALVFNTSLDLSAWFRAQCRDDSNCTGIGFELNSSDPVTRMPRFLVAGRGNTPMLEFGSAIDLSKNQARGRPLVTRYTTGARVEYEMLRPQNFDTYLWPTKDLSGTNCSGKMERSITTTELNNVFLEQPTQVTYTAGLFFLFQNARMLPQLAHTQSLDFIHSDRQIRLAMAVPVWQGITGLVGGALVMLLGILVFINTYERISDWSIGQLQIPQVFVSAFANSADFPRRFFDLHLLGSDAGATPVDLRKVRIESIVFGPLPTTGGSVVLCQSSSSDPSKQKELHQK